jgi:hypothetical protein
MLIARCGGDLSSAHRCTQFRPWQLLDLAILPPVVVQVESYEVSYSSAAGRLFFSVMYRSVSTPDLYAKIAMRPTRLQVYRLLDATLPDHNT